MKFYIKQGDDVSYKVYVAFNTPGELDFGEPDKQLASFCYREDAEAYRAKKEKEYK